MTFKQLLANTVREDLEAAEGDGLLKKHDGQGYQRNSRGAAGTSAGASRATTGGAGGPSGSCLPAFLPATRLRKTGSVGINRTQLSQLLEQAKAAGGAMAGEILVADDLDAPLDAPFE